MKFVNAMATGIIKFFLKLFDTEPQQPWLTKGGIYLLYDFVHLLKNRSLLRVSHNYILLGTFSTDPLEK